MKKIACLILALLSGVTCLFAAASCTKNKTDETVILGFDADFPPYGYQDESGDFVGFDIEFAKKVCSGLGLKLNLKPIDWDSKDALLASGDIDFIWNGFTYEGREDKYEWTVRYLDNSIVVLTNDENITSLADLAGKKVAAQSDSSGEAALNQNETLKATFYGGDFALESEYNTACQKLIAGSYDAIVVDIGVAKYLSESNSSLRIVEEAVSSETYAVGFKKGNTELCKKISDEMVKVGKNEEFIKGLCEKYGVDYNSFLLK